MKLNPSHCRLAIIICSLLTLGFSGCHMNFTMMDGYFFDYSGETAEFTDQGTIEDSITKIKIDNRFGDVNISQSPGVSDWKWESKVWADTQEQADKFIEEFVMDVKTEGDTQTWTVLLPDSASELNGVKSNLTLHVPSNVEIQMENRHGDVELKDLTGNINVENSHGNLNATQIADGTIDVSHGDTTVHIASGSVSIESAHGNVNVDEIKGELKIDGSHTDIKAKSLEGNVISETTHGSTTISTSGESVSAEGSHGNVKVVVTNPAFTSIDIETSHGEIELELPAVASPSIEMDVKHGASTSDFESNEKSVQTVKAKTRHGDIEIKKAK